MRPIAKFCVAALVAIAPEASAAPLREAAMLDHALAGRVAQPPVRCIDYDANTAMTIIDGVGILYDSGGRLYLNRPVSGLRSLNGWNIPVTEINGGSLCSNEVVKMVDRSGGMISGIVFLGDFIPYAKVARAKSPR